MTTDAETFKNIVMDLLYKNNADGTVTDIHIDEQINKTFIVQAHLGLNVSEKEKLAVRNELLTDNKIRLEPGVAIVPLTHKEWFVERKPEIDFAYWNRFKKLLIKDKGFPMNVVAEMDTVSDEIVDLLGDPSRTDEREQRRGLIIGDVQSGKTVNYSGIICKAVDAGFRTVILMTGTTNDLRKQTQIRLDEAFMGVDTSTNGKKETLEFIGAGKYDHSLRPLAFTTVEKDFSVSAAKQMTGSLSQSAHDKPMLFVIKKNVSVLKNLLTWVKSYNQIATNKIENSILMIDDEADFASVNTKVTGDDPSKTNGYIEELLNVFKFSSYVGFTATPYANVFIDPDTDEDMQKEGLFPKDYIYSLNAPTNYIGARDIFPLAAKYHSMLKSIDDGEDFYPLKHKKDDDFGHLSESLRSAINTFLLANVIRDLRDDKLSHRSMMINVTRFVYTQQMLKRAVDEYTKGVIRSVKNYASLPAEKALKDQNLESLFNTYVAEYADVEFSWDQIQRSLFESLQTVQVMVAHGGGDDLNYHEHEDGLRTIVIGGQRLSRGLTLEGLIVSYLYRNSMAYDTLMQMGRWFGYRKGYDDICRIWMDEVSQDWYRFVSEATDELRDEIKHMRDRGATPLDFGLKVRNDPDIPLIVTARNKMRTSKVKFINVSLSEKSIETPFIHNDIRKNEINLKAVRGLVETADFKPKNKQFADDSLSKEKVIELLNNIDVPVANLQFDPQSLAEFIKNYAGHELDVWDAVIMSGDTTTKYNLTDTHEISPNLRNFDLYRDTKVIRISKAQRRLGSQGNTKYGLTKDQIMEVSEIVKRQGRRSINDDDYFSISRNPLLLIYFIEPNRDSDDYDKLVEFENTPLIGFGIGIPRLGDVKTKYVSYHINRIHQEFGGIEEYEDSDE